MCDDRPWRLTAPWWRWPKVGAPGRDVRSLPPALQKYDSSDPVTVFVGDPQRTLEYGDQDFVQALVGAGASGAKLGGWSAARLEPTATRKVFLPSHKRFYLVVVELHCDSPGFPSVAREKVCEAGMVVRRRRLTVASEHAPRALEILASIGAATARIAEIDRGLEKRVLRKRHPRGRGAGAGMAATATQARTSVEVALREVALRERALLAAERAEARTRLLGWKSDSGATVVAEGWMAGDFENVGAWEPVGDAPDAVQEVVYPLYPLVADPRNPAHDAAGRSIWFGMLPTGSREVEVTGESRFDGDSRYEVRCFVRRHRCDCPKNGRPNDCGGDLVWSAPTEAFQLAPHFDPVGTGNHPITIQMPDLPALAAAAPSLPVRMKFPAGSALNFRVDGMAPTDPTTNSAEQICFFSIPLITIVAMFVLNLFLPIVVFLFQLWFLLGLKFCIPPSLTLQAGAALALDAELDAAISVSAGVELEAALAGSLNLALTGDAHVEVEEDADGELHVELVDAAGTPGLLMAETFETGFLAEVDQALTADRQAEVDAASIVTGLRFVERVERWEVAA